MPPAGRDGFTIPPWYEPALNHRWTPILIVNRLRGGDRCFVLLLRPRFPSPHGRRLSDCVGWLAAGPWARQRLLGAQPQTSQRLQSHDPILREWPTRVNTQPLSGWLAGWNARLSVCFRLMFLNVGRVAVLDEFLGGAAVAAWRGCGLWVEAWLKESHI